MGQQTITERAFKIGICCSAKVRRSLPTKSEDLPMNCYRKQQQTNVIKMLTNASLNTIFLFSQPVGRLLADCRSTVGRQVFWGALLHNYPYADDKLQGRTLT